MNYIRPFSRLNLHDVPLVGGKNAALGELISTFDGGTTGIKVPQGFAITVQAYWDHLTKNDLYQQIKSCVTAIEQQGYSAHSLTFYSTIIRTLIEEAPLDKILYGQIADAYNALCKQLNQENVIVVVRSSATAEDLPNASFAGQQDSFLNVVGIDAIINSYKKCLASLFTERALLYRKEKNFDHLIIAMSVGVQQMVRADQGCAGVAFTLEPETGFKDIIVINAAPGLGQALVQGTITPDEYHVFKPFVFLNKPAITKKTLREDAQHFCLSDEKILELAHIVTTIEVYYKKMMGNQSALDIEWAQDGITQELYIVQVRPETIHSLKSTSTSGQFRYMVHLRPEQKPLVVGHSIGQKAVTGTIKCLPHFSNDHIIEETDIIVTHMTDPDWMPLLKKAAGVITENGGRTCHAAIVSRELGIPAIVGASNALQLLTTGQQVTLDCTQGMQGYVYQGACPITKEKVDVQEGKGNIPCNIGLIIADPNQAYTCSSLPVDEVGLVRLEFMITHHIKAHPMALLFPEKVEDKITRDTILSLSKGYSNGPEFFVKKLAEGIATIAAAFYPRPVLVRFSDFKSNEYRNLLGGCYWEPHEENPMLGLRGASRYYNPIYEPAFILECHALDYVRTVMGFTNVNVMVPFVRTLAEGKKVKDILETNGLVSGKEGLKIFMMCELPSNVILLEQFAHIFDGFSIGSNDLTQTVLAVDRDSGALAELFKEDDHAVMYMIKEAIAKAHKAGKKIGICGQAPSDNKALAESLIQHNIDSISLNIDTVIPFIHTNQWLYSTTNVCQKNIR